jgi:IclR family transcriptional regulator, KDG regulon repressor
MVQVGVKSADRVLDILELLAGEAVGLTLTEISDRLGIAQSSTHGLVHTLLDRGYVSLEEGGRFRLGVRLIQLGLNVSDRLELRSVAHPRLEQLVESTQDTALLVIPSDGDLLYVDKVISDARDVRTDPRMSMNRPLHCSSLGKALLATLDDDGVRAALAGEALDSVTEFSIADQQELLADLAETRRRGYSIDRQEAVLGVWCVGAPIRDHSGRAVAAISVSTIKEFFDPATSGPLVLDAALDISRAMGWVGDASTLYDRFWEPRSRWASGS